jgi:hypothetical protein
MSIAILFLSFFVIFFITVPIFKNILFKMKFFKNINVFYKVVICLSSILFLSIILYYPIEFVIHYIYNDIILEK